MNQIFNERKPDYFSKAYQDIFASMSIHGKYKIIGSGNLQGILYSADVDLSSEGLTEKEEPNQAVQKKILKIFQEKFKKEKENKNVYITDFKCGGTNDKPIRWDKHTIEKGEQPDGTKFIDCILMPAMMKIDFVAFINGVFVEFSENFYVTIGENRNFDPQLAVPKVLAKRIMENGLEYYKEGKYLKSLKRLFSVFRLLDTNESVLMKLLDFFNSQVGLINKCKADLETVIIVIDQKFRPCPLKDIELAIQNIKQSLMVVGDVMFKGEFISGKLDKLLEVRSKKEIRKKVENVVSYLGDIINGVSKEFIDKNLRIKKFFELKKTKK